MRSNWDTVSNPMGALQSIIHEQSNEIRSLRAALDEANTELRVVKECADSEAVARAEAETERDRAVAQVRELRKHASAVMAALEQYGPGIVGHLLDTDDNAGEYLRRALAGQDNGDSDG